MGLRILLQCIYYPPEVGGLESHVAGLAEGLAMRGHGVDMLTSRSRAGLPRRETRAGVNVRRVWMPSRGPLGWAAHIAATVGAHRGMAGRADIFHAQTFACVPPAISSRRRFPRPLVLTLHTSHFLVRAAKPLWRRFLRRMIASADFLFATSGEILDVALSLYPHPRAKVLTNAVDTQRFRPDAAKRREGERRRIVVPRRLFHKNGVEYFIRALPAVAGEVDVEAWIIGDGPLRGELEGLAKGLGLEDRIRFLGARPNEDMPGLLAGADVAVIPSLMEATSIAALEALSSGVPVAASHVGGLPEIVDRDVGALFPPADPGALAATLVELLRRTDLPDLGREGRRRVVENWSLDRLVQHHLTVYEMLLDESKRENE